MNESMPFMPAIVLAIIGLLLLVARNLENKKKRKYTYRELSPEEIIARAAKRTGPNIYGKRNSGHLDIEKFVNRHAR